MTIRITAEMIIDETQLAVRDDFIRQATRNVVEREQGETLVYEFYQSNAEPTKFVVNEAYLNEAALVRHFQNLGPLMSVVTSVFQIESLTICGQISAEFAAQLQALGAKIFTHYPDSCQSG